MITSHRPARASRHDLSPLLALTVALCAACAGEDIENEIPYDEAPVRPPQQRPVDPWEGGGDEVIITPGLDAEVPPPDMGQDAGTDATTPDMPPPDAGGCDRAPECAAGSARCQGAQTQACVRDSDGCAVWDLPSPCPTAGDVCTGMGVCQPEPPMCQDNDGDLRGPGCAQGPDCDDSDATVYSGAPELCDAKDNDCTSLVADGVAGVGTGCEVGVGACRTQGFQACTPSGQLACDAQAGTPTAEVCDGADNDCDGQIDEGSVCMTPMCAQDDQEVNDSVAQAFAMTLEDPITGFTCAGDAEYFSLPVTAGTTYRLYLSFPHQLADLDLNLYENGTLLIASDSVTDHEGVQFPAKAGSSYVAEVQYISGQDQVYRLELVDDWACPEWDVFEHNNQISDAPYLLENWQAPAHMCSTDEDWYYIGEQVAGATISIEAIFSTSFFGDGDLDLELYSDPDGDNTYSVAKAATASGDDEYLTYTVPTTGPFFIRVFPYSASDDNYYSIRWSN